MEALRAHFRPEFLNRIDEIVIFQLARRARSCGGSSTSSSGSCCSASRSARSRSSSPDRAKDLLAEAATTRPTARGRSSARSSAWSWTRSRAASSAAVPRRRHGACGLGEGRGVAEFHAGRALGGAAGEGEGRREEEGRRPGGRGRGGRATRLAPPRFHPPFGKGERGGLCARSTRSQDVRVTISRCFRFIAARNVRSKGRHGVRALVEALDQALLTSPFLKFFASCTQAWQRRSAAR